MEEKRENKENHEKISLKKVTSKLKDGSYISR